LGATRSPDPPTRTAPPAMTADHREAERRRAMQRLVVDQAIAEFDRRFEGQFLGPVVALVCAYNEADNLGAVLKGVPEEADGLPVTTLVVVDGGDDGTDRVALDAGVPTVVLPVNLGHGVALWVGYELAVERGAQYVVTIDADGQNDPAELPGILRPLVDDEVDFVVGSRRLGVDETEDVVRRTGVHVFAALTNLLTGATLTDTSSGYRALRATMLADVLPHLAQEQYQTAELLITALARGWRVGERPTVWHARASGSSKKGSNVLFGFRYAGVVLSTWWRERKAR
jgi:glycosyltransferase involved in cell wall biosynthesis